MLSHYFMVRNKKTGLYSSGAGTFVEWTTKGKIWKQRNHATLHIACNTETYQDAELVEFAFEPIEINSTPIAAITKDRMKRLEYHRLEREDYSRKLEYKQARRIVEKYENK